MNENIKGSIVMVDLIPSMYSEDVKLIIKACPFCGNRHNHGMGEGWRLSHCYNKDGSHARTGSYYLQIDWSIPEHTALRERYEKVLSERGEQ